MVGAGATGAPLAARLSDNPDRRVLLLEAGADEQPAELLDPATMPAAAPGHSAAWAFPARLTPDVTAVVPRGRIVGGSTAVNGGYFMRGAPVDFDRWAALGNPRGRGSGCGRSSPRSRTTATSATGRGTGRADRSRYAAARRRTW